MGKNEVANALYALDTALSVIRDNVVMPASGNIYPFYERAKQTLRLAEKSLENLHEQPYKEERANTEDAEAPQSCYCNTTNHPPCGFCTKDIV